MFRLKGRYDLRGFQNQNDFHELRSLKGTDARQLEPGIGAVDGTRKGQGMRGKAKQKLGSQRDKTECQAVFCKPWANIP